jgi:hypothetical protein
MDIPGRFDRPIPFFPISLGHLILFVRFETPASYGNLRTNLLESPANIHPADSSGMLFVVSAARLYL